MIYVMSDIHGHRRRFAIKRCRQIKLFFSKILFYIIVLNRRLFIIDKLNLFRDNVNSRYMIVLCKQYCKRQSNITCSCYCYLSVRFLKLPYTSSSFTTKMHQQ